MRDSTQNSQPKANFSTSQLRARSKIAQARPGRGGGEYSTYWATVTARPPQAVSATCKRWGAQASKILALIFRMYTVPAEFQQLILWLYGRSVDGSPFEAYLVELAAEYYDIYPRSKREASNLARRLGRLLAKLGAWQDGTGYQLIQYFPGDKLDEESRPSKFLLPLAELFARIFREGRSTATLADKREAKLLRVAEQIITAEFGFPARPERMRPKSLPDTVRIDRRMASLITEVSNLDPQLTDAQREYLWRHLDRIRPKSMSVIQEDNGIHVSDPPGRSEYIHSDPRFIENTGLARQLDASSWPIFVDGREEKSQGGAAGTLSPVLAAELKPPDIRVRPPIGQTIEDFIAETWPDVGPGADEDHSLEAAGVETITDERPTPAEGQTDQGETAPNPPPCDFLRSDSLELRDVQGHGQLAIEAIKTAGGDVSQWLLKNDETAERIKEGRAKKGADIERRQSTTAVEFPAELDDLIADSRMGGLSLIATVTGSVRDIDDCDVATASVLAPYSFLILETSPGSYHCLLAIKDPDIDAIVDRLLKGLRARLPGTTANRANGGSMRWPESQNFKPGRDSYLVRIIHMPVRRVVTAAELEAAGLLAPKRTRAKYRPTPLTASGNWPDYHTELMKKPHPTKPGEWDRSAADAAYICKAIRYGRSLTEIAAKLPEVSERARQGGPAYIGRTIDKESDWMSMQPGVIIRP